jgi:hypothetical protein
MTNWHKSNLVALSIHKDLQVWNELELIFQYHTTELVCSGLFDARNMHKHQQQVAFFIFRKFK